LENSAFTIKTELMYKLTFLGHDNASLSMFYEALHTIYKHNVSTSIVSIMEANKLLDEKIPFAVDGIPYAVCKHEEWIPEIDSEIILGTMVAKIKQKIFAFFNDNYSINHEQYTNLYHPTSVISKTNIIGTGVTIGPGAVIAPYAVLGNHVSVNRNATIGHHTTVCDFATLNPGCNIAGFCRIEEGVTIGMGANVIDGRRIGKNSTIGAGSLVTKDIPDNVVAYGVPAKIVRDK